jgi:hypothetical protein
MTIEQLIEMYQARREKIWEEMQQGTPEYDTIRSEWLTLNYVMSNLAIVKAGYDAKFTFEQFENHYMETVQMFKENAIVNIENNQSNYMRQAYCDGYLTAIDSLTKAFDHSARAYLMRKDDKNDLSDQE